MKLIGIVLMIAGVFLGLYVGIWVFFIGGIVDVIEQIRAPALEATGVAIGIAKVMFAGIVGTIMGGFLFLIGLAMLTD